MPKTVAIRPEPASPQSAMTADTLTNLVTGMGTSRDKRGAHRSADSGRIEPDQVDRFSPP